MADAEVDATSDPCLSEKHPSRLKDCSRCTSCNRIKKNPAKLRSSDRARKSQSKVASGSSNKTQLSALVGGSAKVAADLRCAEALVENVDIGSLSLIVKDCLEKGSKVMDCNSRSDSTLVDRGQSSSTSDADKVQGTTTYTLIENGEISTSDYDSCFETDVDSDNRSTVMTGNCDVCGGGGVRDGDDADSGVVDNGCGGAVPIGNDFVVSLI